MTHMPIIGIPCRNDESVHWHWPMQGVGQDYITAFARAGAAPVLIPLGMGELALDAVYRHVQGLLLFGGVDIDPATYGQVPHPKLGRTDPQRDRDELYLARKALRDGLPVLGICRGIQMLNVASGGTLFQDIETQAPGATLHPPAKTLHELKVPKHDIDIEPDSWLARTLGETRLRVNTGHHQAVDRVTNGLRVVARAPDGIIEAVERDAPVSNTRGITLGVQFHPEQLIDVAPWAMRLFEGWVGAVE